MLEKQEKKNVRRRKIYQRAVAAAAVCLMLLSSALMSGCDKQIPFIGSGNSGKAQTVVSGDIYIPMNKVKTLNPLVSRDEDTYYISKLIYEGLFELDETLSARPALAESYSYDDGGETLTIQLKSGVQWHDGKAFTSSDVKFTIDTLLAVQNSADTIYGDYVKNIRSVKTRGDSTVVITFKSADNVSTANLTFPIIPDHQFKKASAARQASDSFAPVGTGPYYAESSDVGKGLVLRGFAGYRSGAAPTNSIFFNVLPNKMDAINLFDINDFTIAFSKEIDRETLITNKDVKVVSFPSNEVEFLGFRCNDPVLSKPEVRKAISMAIDEKSIIETAYYNSGVQNDNIYYPNYMGVESQKKLQKVDLKKAQKLLGEAGLSDQDGDGYLEDENGNSIHLRILYNTENNSRNTAAQLIQQGLEKLKIHSELVGKEWAGYNSAVASGSYELYIGGYQIQDTYDLRFLLKTGQNPLGYSNPELDALLDQMASGITEEEKTEVFSQIKKLLVDELPYNCLLYKTYGAISSKSLKGKLDPYFFNLYHGCEGWTCEYTQEVKTNEKTAE